MTFSSIRQIKQKLFFRIKIPTKIQTPKKFKLGTGAADFLGDIRTYLHMYVYRRKQFA